MGSPLATTRSDRPGPVNPRHVNRRESVPVGREAGAGSVIERQEIPACEAYWLPAFLAGH